MADEADTRSVKQRTDDLIEAIKITKSKLATNPLHPDMRAKLETVLDTEFQRLVDLAEVEEVTWPRNTAEAGRLLDSTIEARGAWTVENESTAVLDLNIRIISALLAFDYWVVFDSESEQPKPEAERLSVDEIIKIDRRVSVINRTIVSEVTKGGGSNLGLIAELERERNELGERLWASCSLSEEQWPGNLTEAQKLIDELSAAGSGQVPQKKFADIEYNLKVLYLLRSMGAFANVESGSESEEHPAELTDAERDAALALVAEQQDRDRRAEAEQRRELDEREKALDELERLVLGGGDWFHYTPDELLAPLRGRIVAGLDQVQSWLAQDDAKRATSTNADASEWSIRSGWRSAYAAYLDSTDGDGNPIAPEPSEVGPGDDFPFEASTDEDPAFPTPETGAEPDTIQTPVARVLVVGSFAWSTPTIVWSVLQEFADQNPNAYIQVITGGCPRGVELAASQWMQSRGGQVETVRDEDIPQMTNITGAFVFIEDESLGAERVLGIVEVARLWHRVIRSTVNTTQTPWADR